MIEIVPYRASWPAEFAELARTLRFALGPGALAIHHIGSTSVPGLAAKDVIDIQVTVAALTDAYEPNLLEFGFERNSGLLCDHCPPGMELAHAELAKQVYGYRERRVNLHVRAAGRFNQRYALLCRDYLRTHALAAQAYSEIKQQLAARFRLDHAAYYAVKDPVFDVLMVGAEAWAASTGWRQPPTDG